MSVDLIILAAVTGFILYRLYATLGKKTGFGEEEHHPLQSNVVNLNTKSEQVPKKRTKELEEIDPYIRDAIQKITRLDPTFSLKSWIQARDFFDGHEEDLLRRTNQNTVH